jgi:hypothetical protein
VGTRILFPPQLLKVVAVTQVLVGAVQLVVLIPVMAAVTVVTVAVRQLTEALVGVLADTRVLEVLEE